MDRQLKLWHGIPAAVIDDRKENRDAVCAENPNCNMLSIGCSVSGFTFDEETSGVQLAITDFLFK
ncbi:MAG: hypothetical protein ACI4SF_08545 [Oscillospiraceae bacterium]